MPIRTSRARVLAVVLAAGALCALGGFWVTAQDEPMKLYVAPWGDDEANGKLPTPGMASGPLATLQGARDRVRAVRQEEGLPEGGLIVEVLGGTYEMAAPLELTAEDSGEEGAPVVYRAREGEEVRLVGGKQVDGFEPVTDQAVLQRLGEEARGSVVQAELRALGVTDYGETVAVGRRLELFYNDEPMALARWPNEDFATIADLLGEEPHEIHGIPGDKVGKFVYEGDRPARWSEEKDLWLHGYWFWDWADSYERVPG